MGCYKEREGQQVLTGAKDLDFEDLTIESCIEWCRGKGFTFAGVKVSYTTCSPIEMIVLHWIS